MNTITQSDIELSERLRRACLEKGILEPRFVAQNKSGQWRHYNDRPTRYDRSGFFSNAPAESVDLFCDESNGKWRETLMKWNPKAGVPLSQVIEYTCEYCGQRI